MNLRQAIGNWSVSKSREFGYNFGEGLIPHYNPAGVSTIQELRLRAISDAADYFEPSVHALSLFGDTESLHHWVAQTIIPALPEGQFLEFGFYRGDSARRLVRGVRMRGDQPTYVAFDSFHGLRNEWSGIGSTTGAFDLSGTPPVPPEGVQLVIGWVEDTLDEWLTANPGTVAIVHMDLDVYPPTKFVLESLATRLERGSSILFDEFHGYSGWRSHEFKALNEVLAPEQYKFVALGLEQALITIL